MKLKEVMPGLLNQAHVLASNWWRVALVIFSMRWTHSAQSGTCACKKAKTHSARHWDTLARQPVTSCVQQLAMHIVNLSLYPSRFALLSRPASLTLHPVSRGIPSNPSLAPHEQHRMRYVRNK